jgi:hypothetical protein
MTQSFIQAVPDSTGKKLVTNTIDPGTNLLHQQRNELADASGVPLAGSSGVDGTTAPGLVIHALVDNNPPQLTTNARQPLSMTSEGRLRVAVTVPEIDFFGADPFDGGVEFSGSIRYV